MPPPYANPTLYPHALTEAEESPGFKWHRAATSPRSSQVFCLSAFGTLRKLATRDAVLEALFQKAFPSHHDQTRPRPWKLFPEAEDKALLSEYGANQPTSIDMLCLSQDAVICIESKFVTDAEHGFGSCSQFPKACGGYYGQGSDLAKSTAAWCRLESWEGARSPRAYWSLGRQYFRPEVFRHQTKDEQCPLRASNYQLMRNFLFAAAMAERDRKAWFGVLTIAPARFTNFLQEQVASFQETILQPAFSDRIAFVAYERYIDLLLNSGQDASIRLGEFLRERIAIIVGR